MKYGIGYTIFAYEGREKRPVQSVKSIAGNVDQELRKLRSRMKRLNDQPDLFGLTLGALMYGFSIRVFFGMI